MSNGHSFKDIQNYTFGQIGVFLRAVRRKIDFDKVDKVNFNWISTNVNQKGIDQVSKDIIKNWKAELNNDSVDMGREELKNNWMAAIQATAKLR